MGDQLQPEELRFEPREYRDELTGRKITMLTGGEAHCYPLYYFIPTVTEDGGTLIFHRWAGDSIQLYRLDVATGEARRLTNAKAERAAWRPWTQPPTTGVRDQLSAFNVVTRELIYFEENQIRGVQIDTLEDRLIYEVPANRTPCGLTGVSPDGRYFIFPHIARSFFENVGPSGPNRAEGRGCVIELLELATGNIRQLLCINSWITHTHFQDNRRYLFCHPATENGLMVGDIHGNWYAHVRTQSGPELDGPVPMETTSHYQATDLGIVYEMRNKVGLCDPYTFECQEYEIADFPVTHIGRDQRGQKFFYDSRCWDGAVEDHKGPRCLLYLPELKFGTANKPVPLTGGVPTFGEGQHTHLHPQLMPDREHILFVGGDARTRTNQLCLLDVADLADTQREERA